MTMARRSDHRSEAATVGSMSQTATRRSTFVHTFWRAVRLSFFLGWQDVRLMYRRSVLGQFWITLSMAITFVAVGVVFGLIFNHPVVEYMPFLASGLMFFAFFTAILNEGAISFISAEPFIRQLPLPPIVHYLKTIWKNVFVLLHNAVALVILLIVFPQGVSTATLLVVPGLLLSGTAIGGLGLGIAMLSTRYRDIPQIVSAVTQISFYLTPIVWLPSSLPGQAQTIILSINPFYHLLEVVRAPLLNQYPSWSAWATALGLAIVFLAIGTGAYQWKRRQLAFWV